MKKTFKVTGMECSNCAMRIEALEDKLSGVKSVAASYAKGQMVVDFDEAQVKVEAIVAAVKKLGYTATAA